MYTFASLFGLKIKLKLLCNNKTNKRIFFNKTMFIFYDFLGLFKFALEKKKFIQNS